MDIYDFLMAGFFIGFFGSMVLNSWTLLFLGLFCFALTGFVIAKEM